MKRFLFAAGFCLLLVRSSTTARAQFLPGNSEMSRQNFNLPIKTGGGTQVWTDVRFRQGFRIQRNSLTGHHRLIDQNDVRRAWGTKTQCAEELDRRVPPQSEAEPQRHVVLLHGLMRTAGSMKTLESALVESGSPSVIRFAYASTRGSIPEHARALREVLERLPEQDSFSFVGHSMGNIVVRSLVAQLESDGDPKRLLPRCKRMIMLGPPNQGATIAKRLSKTKVFGWVTGKGALQLGPDWEALQTDLATPTFPFHIIAGDVLATSVNPLVDGDGDFVVSVEEAKLEGCETFETYPVLHSFLMD
ncbi:MAG: alpha/beta hydrolase, partial [Planctomycetota bacterium]